MPHSLSESRPTYQSPSVSIRGEPPDTYAETLSLSPARHNALVKAFPLRRKTVGDSETGPLTTGFCRPTCQASRSIRTVSSWAPKKRTAAAVLALDGD